MLAAMHTLTASLHHLRILLRLVELLFAPVLALAAQGKFCTPTMAAELALARLERGFCDTMRRQLVAMGYARAADAPDAYFLGKLYRDDPGPDDPERFASSVVDDGWFDDAGAKSWRAIIRFARLCGKRRPLACCALQSDPIQAPAPSLGVMRGVALVANARVRAPP
jgi:hypothetical protein